MTRNEARAFLLNHGFVMVRPGDSYLHEEWAPKDPDGDNALVSVYLVTFDDEDKDRVCGFELYIPPSKFRAVIKALCQ